MASNSLKALQAFGISYSARPYSRFGLPLFTVNSNGARSTVHYSKQNNPACATLFGHSDGTKLNLYYRNESGKICTTSVYEVMDAYSEVLLGYDIAPGEKFDSQFRAFRMAVETRQGETLRDRKRQPGRTQKVECTRLL